MPSEVMTYHLNPLYVWGVFMLYNMIKPLISGVISESINSLDYRAVLILVNVFGLYVFLRHVRIDFTLRLMMNQ